MVQYRCGPDRHALVLPGRPESAYLDLAVKDDPNRNIFVTHRLMSGF